MGLDVSHDSWRGAYSAFSRWRNTIAQAAGYALETYPSGHTTAALDWDRFTAENLRGEWPQGPPGEDPLLVLIVHSDCDGVIKPEHAKPLADRLEGLLDKLPAGEGGGHIGDWRVTTQRFIDGLRKAAADGEEVEFD